MAHPLKSEIYHKWQEAIYSKKPHAEIDAWEQVFYAADRDEDLTVLPDVIHWECAKLISTWAEESIGEICEPLKSRLPELAVLKACDYNLYKEEKQKIICSIDAGQLQVKQQHKSNPIKEFIDDHKGNIITIIISLILLPLGVLFMVATLVIMFGPIVGGILIVAWLAYTRRNSRQVNNPDGSFDFEFTVEPAIVAASTTQYASDRIQRQKRIFTQQREEEVKRIRKSELNQRKQESYWRNMDPFEFEEKVGELFRELGYTAETTPRSGDFGVDIILELKGEKLVAQCKRYNHEKKLAPNQVLEFVGAMRHYQVEKGIIIALNGLSFNALQVAQKNNISVWTIKELLEFDAGGFVGEE